MSHVVSREDTYAVGGTLVAAQSVGDKQQREDETDDYAHCDEDAPELLVAWNEVLAEGVDPEEENS